MTRLFFITLFLGLSFPTFSGLPSAGDARVPSRVDISYSITSGNLEGEVNDTVEIRHENGTRSYSIYSEGRAKGLLALTQPDNLVRDSEGTVTAKGVLRPTRFSDQHGKKLPKVALFDWTNKSLTLQFKGKEEQRSLPANESIPGLGGLSPKLLGGWPVRLLLLQILSALMVGVIGGVSKPSLAFVTAFSMLLKLLKLPMIGSALTRSRKPLSVPVMV